MRPNAVEVAVVVAEVVCVVVSLAVPDVVAVEESDVVALAEKVVVTVLDMDDDAVEECVVVADDVTELVWDVVCELNSQLKNVPAKKASIPWLRLFATTAQPSPAVLVSNVVDPHTNPVPSAGNLENSPYTLFKSATSAEQVVAAVNVVPTHAKPDAAVPEHICRSALS